MTNWSPFLVSDEMDAWLSGSWPGQQSQQTPQPPPLSPNPALQSGNSHHPSTPSLPPFLPPLFDSLPSLHSSSLGWRRPSLGFHSSLAPATTPVAAHSHTDAVSSALGGQSSFPAAPAFSTPSQLARRRRRRDGLSLALSQHPSTGPHRPSRPADYNTTTTTSASSSATTAAARQSSAQRQIDHSPSSSRPTDNNAPQNFYNTIATPLHSSLNSRSRQARLHESSNDFLDALATADFSSPSLPPYSPQSPPQHRPQYDQFLNHSADPRPPAVSTPAARRLPHPDTGLFKVEDQGDVNCDFDEKSPIDLLRREMPATRKRSRAAAASSDDHDVHDVGPSAPKRPRTAVAHRAATPGRSRTTPRPASRKYTPVQKSVTIGDDDNDSLFGGDGDSGGVELFDLTNSDDAVPQELFQPVKDTSIKLSAFECVICMDAATNLTVTCCGHMFCAQCLHQAMHTELTKKVCPMCRQRLDKPTPKSKPPAKAFFPLELKLRPSKKVGKQPARR